MLWGGVVWWGSQVLWPIFQDAINGEKPQIDFVHTILPVNIAVLLVAMIPGALMRAALYRYRAGEGVKGVFFAFRFGADEVRQYLANWLFLIIVFVVPVAVIAPLIRLAVVLNVQALSMTVIMVAIMGIPLIMIVLGVRFSLMFAQVYAQKKMVLWQSWSLTRGHFWVLFLSFSVLIILFSLVSFAITTPANILFYMQQATGWIGDPNILKNMEPADIRALIQESLLSQKTIIAVAWVVLAGTIISVFQVAVYTGASLFAVQTLKQKTSTQRR
ncbi:MAG: hypothetical protein Q9M45_06990 [Robiginitomaculum sp.]|nr:hypothetical protein [Robiginitomaculum sp.]